MLIPKKEASFAIMAPYESHKCQWQNCHKMGEFHVFAKNDRNVYLFDYQNICDQHVIMAAIEFCSMDSNGNT